MKLGPGLYSLSVFIKEGLSSQSDKRGDSYVPPLTLLVWGIHMFIFQLSLLTYPTVTYQHVHEPHTGIWLKGFGWFTSFWNSNCFNNSSRTSYKISSFACMSRIMDPSNCMQSLSHWTILLLENLSTLWMLYQLNEWCLPQVI